MTQPPQLQPRSGSENNTQVKTWTSSPAVASSLLLAKMALKIAAAAVLSYSVAQALRWEYPFYAVIAAVIVVGSTAGSTWNSGIQRIIGTIAGAITGAMFSVLLGSTSVSLGISVFLTIFLTSVCKLNEAAKLAGYVSAIVILNHGQQPWLYAWGRFLETVLGISAAILVSHVLFPTYAGAELRGCMSRILLDLEQLHQLVMQGALTEAYDRTTANTLKTQIIASFQKNRALRKEVKQGQAGESSETVIDEIWDFLLHRIWEHVLTMEHTVLTRQQDGLWQALSPQLTQLSQETSSAMIELATAVKFRKRRLLLPDLDAALAHTIEQFDRVQRIGYDDYPANELLRFFTFLYTMEEVDRKLQRMANTL